MPTSGINFSELKVNASFTAEVEVAQLEQNYGKEGADVIIDNTQLTIFGGFAPNSTSAEVLSKSLGSRTVMSGSVSKSKNDPSQSLQMIERPLMTPDELKSLPKGTFVVMKTGFYPMRVKLKLFFKWGIEFEEQYQVAENGNRNVQYANRVEIINGIIESYPPELTEKPVPETDEVDNPQTGNIRTEPNENDDESKGADKKTVLKTEAKYNEQP